MHDAAVVHRAVRHRLRMIGGAHHAVEVALHDAHALRITVHAVHHEHRGRHRHRDTAPEREPLQPHRDDDRQHEQRDAELEVAGQDERRHDRDQHRAERAAERDHQVEAREMRRIGLCARELAVAEHAGEKEADEIERRGDAQVERWHVVRHGRQQHEQRGDEERPHIPARMVEGENESDQIKRERQHPEERHARDVLRDVVGDREQHYRAHRGEPEPQQLVGKRYRTHPCGLFASLGDAVGGHQADRGAQHRKAAIDERPAPAELPQIEHRLEQQRKSKQRQQRGEVGQREQAIGHGALEAAPVPRLQ